MKKIVTQLIFLLNIIVVFGQNENQDWKTFSEDFATEYRTFEFQRIALSYVENLERIKSDSEILKQESFFKIIKKGLKRFDSEELSKENRMDFELISYETDLNLERISLEKKWKKKNIDSISKEGLSKIPHGKKWYKYFLKRWLDSSVNPDELFQFGLLEIEKVKNEMKLIQEKSGLNPTDFKNYLNASSFYFKNKDSVQLAFESKKILIENVMKNYFPYIEETPDFQIKKGENKALAKVPGFYNSNTFYYNFFDKPYNKRQVTWLFLHEAIPGHHYQVSYESRAERSEINRLFQYFWFIEGYAAYVEDLALEINLYDDIYEVYGKYEWDIIRSVRVALDVGINYYHWSDEKALKFWQKHIEGKDDIALREIERMKNWPVQVITYKYGADKILKWKSQAMKNSNFDLIEFHKVILKNGSLPISVLNSLNLN
ncbi:DUF885 domain-containing protein [Aureivirga sp. CE67]|uniref:DUF885 domain-containing protein n=1 Tax=Aureivirga sp. CE67 TaxID=1788983 RepID=UPI0018C979D3|nr:DUF885 domain-containing protein [Aureivirga sp. CE67]